MDSEFSNSINEHPELFYILKSRKNNGLIFQTDSGTDLIEPLKWMYSNFYSKNIIVFDTINAEELEKVNSTGNIIIFVHADFLLNGYVKWNKRRINTTLKNLVKKNEVLLLTLTNLKCLELPSLSSFDIHESENKITLENVSLFDLETDDDLESFVDTIESYKSKSIYVSMNVVTSEFIALLKFRGVKYSKDGSKGITIHSCKTTEKMVVHKKYDVYFYSLPLIEYPLDILHYFNNPEGEYFLDVSNLKNVQWCLKGLYSIDSEPKIQIKDSAEFPDTSTFKELGEYTIASEGYYFFPASETIKDMDLSNLKKGDTDSIRNFIKVKMTSKYDIDIRTCQISTPSSPRDRSRKLNSLSNKISSFDYRCDATCEIFKDYSIGVVIWNDFFRNRKEINIIKNHYVYQTTSGKWKYTTVH